MIWKRWNRQSRLLGSLMLSGVIIASAGDCAFAQIRPDNTLPTNSRVTSDSSGLPIDRIDQGTIRGANLFHSFREFNVGEGRGAYFSNPGGIENILSRVTGNNPSNILGTLGVLGNANLFLMNPNGILFGPNASLDVGGSFVGTTANGIQLGNTARFSASEPGRSNLLSVNPSALFFNAVAAQAIVNQSTAGTTVTDSSTNGLQVPNGRSLLLVGGNVSLEGGKLTATGGRVELGGVAGSGTVGLNGEGNNLSLSFPDQVVQADISLTNGALVDASGEGGGNVQIQSDQLDMTQRSFVFADTLGADNGGGVLVRAIEAVTLSNGSLITSDVFGSGTGGDLRIETGQLSIQDGARVSAGVQGRGNAGNVNIDVRDAASFDGVGSDGFPSGAFSSVFPQGKGSGGDLNFKAGSLSLTNGAQVSASTFGRGNAGNVNIDVRDAASFDGVGSDGFPSGAFSSVFPQGKGSGGDLNFKAGSLSLTNGAQVSASTFGRGDAGNLRADVADSVELIGTSPDGQFTSGIRSAVEFGALGDGGSLTLETGRLLVRDGAQMSTATFGQGDAGDVTIRGADAISFDGVASNGLPSGLLSSVQAGAIGNAGDITVESTAISLSNGAQLSASTFGDGNAGNLEVESSLLSLTNGAQISASTFGKGNAGNLEIVALDISFDGVGANGSPSGAFSSVRAEALGKGGSINLEAGSLSLTNGAQVSASTFGRGDAGNLTFRTVESVVIGTSPNGQFASGIRSAVEEEARGSGGDLNLATRRLLVRDGAQVSTATFGLGDAGNLTFRASNSVELIGTSADGRFSSGIFTGVFSDARGSGGNLTFETGRLLVRDGAQVSTSTFGEGSAGDLTFRASNYVELIGTSADGRLSSSLQSAVGEGAVGNGGNLTLDAIRLLVRDGAEVTVSGRGSGDAGNLRATAPTIQLDNQGKLTAETTSGQGGNITLLSQDLSMRRNSQISAEARGTGNSGNIGIKTEFLIARPSENSDIVASAERGGNIAIAAQGIFGIQFRENLTLYSDITATGTVTLNTPDTELQGSLTQLSANFISPEQVVSGSCLARRNVERGSFIVTGTGGLPHSPYEAIRGQYDVTGVQPIQGNGPAAKKVEVVENSTWKLGDPIQEAQGMMVTADGRTIVGTNSQLVTLAKAQDMVC